MSLAHGARRGRPDPARERRRRPGGAVRRRADARDGRALPRRDRPARRPDDPRRTPVRPRAHEAGRSSRPAPRPWRPCWPGGSRSATASASRSSCRAATSRSAGSASCSPRPATLPGRRGMTDATVRRRPPIGRRPLPADPADRRSPAAARVDARTASARASTCSARATDEMRRASFYIGVIVLGTGRRRSPSPRGPSRSATVHLTVDRDRAPATSRPGYGLVRLPRLADAHRAAGRGHREPDRGRRRSSAAGWSGGRSPSTRPSRGRGWCSGGRSVARSSSGIPLVDRAGRRSTRSSKRCSPTDGEGAFVAIVAGHRARRGAVRVRADRHRAGRRRRRRGDAPLVPRLSGRARSRRSSSPCSRRRRSC